MKDAGKLIRKELKEKLGLSNRHVSVKEVNSSYSWIFHVTIKTERALEKQKEIENICEKYEDIDRCEYSGEILSGGNTLISVQVDWDLYQRTQRA